MCVCACVCVYTSGDLLNRPRFQFHASEFDGGGERWREEGEGEGEVERVPSH